LSNQNGIPNNPTLWPWLT